MPLLELLLSNDTLIYRAETGEDEWGLALDAQPARTYKDFDVIAASQRHDGFDLRYSVKLRPRTPNNIAWAQKLAEMSRSAAHRALSVTPDIDPLGTIALTGWGYGGPPVVEIIVLLSKEDVFRVHQNLATHVCRLLLQTCSFEAGFVYGDAPDGSDVRWDAEKVEVAIVESMSLHFDRPSLERRVAEVGSAE